MSKCLDVRTDAYHKRMDINRPLTQAPEPNPNAAIADELQHLQKTLARLVSGLNAMNGRLERLEAWKAKTAHEKSTERLVGRSQGNTYP